MLALAEDGLREGALAIVAAEVKRANMVAILHEEDFDRWLQAPIENALSLARTFPSQLLAVD